MPTSNPLHAVTWLLWAVAAAATLQLAGSPVYVVLVIAIALAVFEAHRLDTTLARALWHVGHWLHLHCDFLRCLTTIDQACCDAQ